MIGGFGEIIFLSLLGTVMGSFLGVLIDRLPQEITLGGRSHCDYCGKPLRPLDLIPIVSYLYLGAKTSCCNKPLSLFYPLIEIITATAYLFVYFWMIYSFGYVSLVLLGLYCIIISALLVILFADVKYHIIPDEMNVVLLFAALVLHIYMSSHLMDLVKFLGAGIAVGGSMLALFLATKGRGLGFGDVKFAFIMGFLLGLEGGFIALYISFVLGGVMSTILLITKKSKMKTKIAFGPFLIIGTVSMIFFGQKIISIFHDLFV